MRILYVCQYFPPEIGAPAARVFELSRRFLAAGHEVRVLTGFPHHPEGTLPPEYRGKLLRGFWQEEYQGVPVARTWLIPAANRGVWKRSLSYASFGLSAAWRGGRLDFRPDVVIGSSPQLLAAWAGMRIARRLESRFVFEVRDLWPESLAAVEVRRPNSILYKRLRALADRLYERAWKIVVTTEATRNQLAEYGVAESKLAVVPAGVDPEKFRPDAPAPEASAAWRGKFNVGYAGTLGLAHGLGTVLEAATLLRDEPGIRFRLIGGGADREALQARARSLALENVEFLGPRPWTEMPGWLAAGDAALVHLKDRPLFESVLPSKLFEAMAAAKPILLGARGEAQRLVERVGAGISFAPEDAVQLAEAVMQLSQREDIAAMGARGRRFAAEEASFTRRAEQYLQILSE